MPAASTLHWGWFLDKKTTFLVVVAVTLLVTTGLLTRQRFVAFEESSQWVAHTHEVIGGIESIQAALMDGETGMRGYLLTREPPFLQPYNAALNNVPKELYRVRTLTSDNPRQQQFFETLEPLVAGQMSILKELIESRPKGPGGTVSMDRIAEGKRSMDAIRVVLREMKEESERMLTLRLEKTAATGQTTTLALVGSILLALLFFTAAVLLVNRNVGTRLRAEQELRQNEEELQQSEHRYRLLFENAGDAILVADEDGCYLDANREAERLTGYTRDELLRLQIADVTPAAARNGCAKMYEEFKGQGEMAGEFQLLCKSGGTVQVEFAASRVGEGRYQSILRNITQRKLVEEERHKLNEELEVQVLERTADLARANGDLRREVEDRKRAEQALDQERQFFWAVLENAQEAIVACDNNGVLTFFNRAARNIHGKNEQPLAAERWTQEYDLYQADGKTPLAKEEIPLFQALQGKQVRGVEMVIRPQSGLARIMLVNGQAIIGNGGIKLGAVVVMHDVSERKQLEEQLHQAQKMEVVGQLAGGVAHDFNNLLTIISGYSQMMLASHRTDDRNREMIRAIYEAGERAALLTRQLLAFSRKQVVEPQVLDLNSVVGSTDRMLRRLIGEDVRLTTVAGSGLDPVKADPGQIEQILMNLVVNARDALPQGGSITIETASVELDENYAQAHAEVKPGRYVLLAVSDTGCGMTEEVQRHIFEPFFTTKGPGKGTGLGLATVYGIVKQSGGHVWLYSEPGHGTTFKIYLPSVVDAAPAQQKSDNAPVAPSGTGTILLVEDDDQVRAMTCFVLQTFGYTVLETRNGKDAIQICETHEECLDLLITDVVMPGMSGRQVAEAVTAIKPTIKVLYVSGYTDDAVVRHGVLQAETAFLQKPFTTVDLARKVKEILGQ